MHVIFLHSKVENGDDDTAIAVAAEADGVDGANDDDDDD